MKANIYSPRGDSGAKSLLVFDPWMALLCSLAVVLAILHFFPLNQEQFYIYSYDYTDVVMLSLVCLALGQRYFNAQKEERSFWGNLFLGFFTWWLIQVNLIFSLIMNWLNMLDIINDLMYFVFYLFLIVALDTRSGRPKGTTYSQARFWLNCSGGILFVAGIFFYFVLIPASLSKDVYETWMPSFYFYVALDCYVFIRLTLLFIQTRSKPWRLVYVMMMMTSGMWAISDLTEALSFTELLPFDIRGPWAIIWYIPYFPLLLATRVQGHFPSSRFSDRVSMARQQQEQVADRLLVVYALALPMLHLSGYAMKSLDVATKSERSLFILMWMVLMGSLSLVQYTLLHRRNTMLEKLRLRNVRILEAIGRVQSEFIAATNLPNVFENMVDHLLRLSESEFGFVGEVHRNESGTPFLRTLAVAHQGRDHEGRKYYGQRFGMGLEIHDLDTLFGAAIGTGEPVIANNPRSDPRRGGFPEGYPEPRCFLGMPLYHRNNLIGMFGIANRDTGYDDDVLKFLAPFFATCAGIISAHRNEREHKRMEEIATRFGRILDNSLQEIYIFDALTLRFLQVNRGARENIGYSSEELRQLTPRDLYPVENDNRFHDLIAPLLSKEKEKIQYTTAHRRKDGSAYPVDVYLQLSSFEGKSVVVAIVVDITERKRMEREKSRLENQVMQSQKLETIGTLAGGIAHDFNNILAPIIWYTEMIVNDLEETDDMREDLRQVLQAANRAKDLVQQILTFGRLSESKQDPVRIQLVMEEAVKLLRASLPVTIEIRTEILSKCDPVYGDATQIHQVIMNLCTNAFHAMREQGGVLSVSLGMTNVTAMEAEKHPNLRPGRFVKLTVSDTGHGMDPTTLTRIFEPFFTTKQVGEGTGLGLSVIHGIVITHGGAITVESKPGTGSSFNVFLPPIDYQSASESRWEGILAKGEEHILFIDDEKEIVHTGKQMLERFGYQVTATTDPEEALSLFVDNPNAYDLVITDQTMPQITGMKLATKLSLIRPGIPIILTTGFSEDATEERRKEAGISEFVLKPVIGRELHECIRRVLEKNQTEI